MTNTTIADQETRWKNRQTNLFSGSINLDSVFPKASHFRCSLLTPLNYEEQKGCCEPFQKKSFDYSDKDKVKP